MSKIKEFIDFFQKNKKIILPFILIILGLCTRFAFLNYPKQVVFDESHFGSFVNSYFIGESYFDIHPPLGKLIIYAGARLGGYKEYVGETKGFDFEFNSFYNEVPYLGFRFFPALFGALIPLVFYYLLKQLKLKDSIAFLSALFPVFENSLIVQSRLILLDGFLIFFGLLGILFFLKAREKKYNSKILIISSVFLGLCFSIKWTGAGFLACALLIVGFDFLFFVYKKRFDLKSYKKRLKVIKTPFLMIFFSLAIYLLTWMIHFSFLPISDYDLKQNGFDKDNSFIVNGYAKLKYIVSHHKLMYTSNAAIRADHPYASKAKKWPLMQKSVLYWTKNNPSGGVAGISFMPNPAVGFLGLIGLAGFVLFFRNITTDFSIKSGLFLGYLVNYVPFLLIERPLFLYSYISAYIFSLILFALFFNFLIFKLPKKIGYLLCFILLALVIVGFWYFSPFVYGNFITQDQFYERSNLLDFLK
ncbi:MAG: phospholipid carrier-dependent glycosyltransferase [Candidatus Moranbacteria bacterium]|nr:phospholipid carrier-dependent glycosyltransferase [Candidatus Moranbacteria bacterium]